MTLLGSAGARAQNSSSVIPLIPAADWQLTQSERVNVQDVARWGGDPAIDAEYGVRSVLHRTYQFENHVADVILEQAPDPSSAYGLFTYYRSPSMAGAVDLLLTATGPQGTLMARGPLFIRVSEPTHQPLPETDLRALLIAAGGKSTRALLNDLPEPLPPQGLAASTAKYVLGPLAAARLLPAIPANLIGFDKGAELQFANYATSAPRTNASQPPVTLAVVSYPNPQIAGAQFALLSKNLGLDRGRGPQSVYGMRQGVYILLVLGAASSHEADTFLNQFKVERRFSWTPPYPGDKPIVIQMVELVLANVQLVLILTGFSMVGGLIVFASKRIARKWTARSSMSARDESGITMLHLG